MCDRRLVANSQRSKGTEEWTPFRTAYTLVRLCPWVLHTVECDENSRICWLRQALSSVSIAGSLLLAPGLSNSATFSLRCCKPLRRARLQLLSTRLGLLRHHSQPAPQQLPAACCTVKLSGIRPQRTPSQPSPSHISNRSVSARPIGAGPVPNIARTFCCSRHQRLRMHVQSRCHEATWSDTAERTCMIQKPPKRTLCFQVTPPQSSMTANHDNTPLPNTHLQDVINCSYENEASGP